MEAIDHLDRSGAKWRALNPPNHHKTGCLILAKLGRIDIYVDTASGG